MPASKNSADLVDAIIQTRKISAEIAASALSDIDGESEFQVAKKLISEMKNRNEIFPTGWYDPPPAGIGVLFDQKSFGRLHYDSLRNPSYWPSKEYRFEKESVGMIYISPVNRETGMLGDIGLTVYKGENEKIKQHVKAVHDAVFEVAQRTEVGMKFSEVCLLARKLFRDKFKMTRWVAISSDPNQTMNLGHTVPGTFDDNFSLKNRFEEIRESIRTKRIHLVDTENFEIPKTCAFTVESRLEDANNPELPSVYFQFIVCFKEGQKLILENFRDIFQVLKMDYMAT